MYFKHKSTKKDTSTMALTASSSCDPFSNLKQSNKEISARTAVFQRSTFHKMASILRKGTGSKGAIIVTLVGNLS